MDFSSDDSLNGLDYETMVYYWLTQFYSTSGDSSDNTPLAQLRTSLPQSADSPVLPSSSGSTTTYTEDQIVKRCVQNIEWIYGIIIWA